MEVKSWHRPNRFFMASMEWIAHSKTILLMAAQCKNVYFLKYCIYLWFCRTSKSIPKSILWAFHTKFGRILNGSDILFFSIYLRLKPDTVKCFRLCHVFYMSRSHNTSILTIMGVEHIFFIEHSICFIHRCVCTSNDFVSRCCQYLRRWLFK